MNMWYFSTWGNHFFHFFIWILFVAENEAVDCDKGNFPVKDKSVLISIDDLVADKIGGQSTDVTRRSNTEGHVVEGNGILFSFISYIFYHYFRPDFHQVMSCSFPPLFSFSVDGFTYSTPAIIAPAPTKKIGRAVPLGPGFAGLESSSRQSLSCLHSHVLPARRKRTQYTKSRDG